MLYRDNGDSIELKTPDSIGNSIGNSIGSGIGNCGIAELQNGGWSLIGSQMIEAAA